MAKKKKREDRSSVAVDTSLDNMSNLTDQFREQLSSYVSGFEEIKKDLQTTTSRLKEKDAEIAKLRDHTHMLELNNKRASQEFGRQLFLKEEQLARMQDAMRENSIKQKEFDLQPEKRKEIDFSQVEKLRSHIEEAERTHNLMVDELSDQLAQREEQLDNLKKFLSEKEKYNTDLLSQYNEQILKREDVVADLKLKMADLEKHMENRNVESERLRDQLMAKSLVNKRVNKQMTDLREQESALRAEIDALQKKMSGEDRSYNIVARKSEKRQEERLKEIIKEHTEKEIDLMSEMEHLKSEIREKEAVLEEKQELIDEAIAEFEVKAGKLLSLRDQSKELDPNKMMREKLDKEEEMEKQREQDLEKVLDQREKESKDYESQIKELEEKFNEEKTKWSEERQTYQDQMNRIEERLGEQQAVRPAPQPHVPEPLPKQAETIEPVETKTVEVEEEKPAHEPEQVLSLPSLKTFKRPKKQRTKIGQGEQPKPADLKKEALNMFSGERAVFSELEEIESMIGVALQQGENPKEIKTSLLNSGYSKDQVEKAIKKIKVSA